MVALRLGLLRCHGAGTAVGVTFELWLAQVTGPGRGGVGSDCREGCLIACWFAGGRATALHSDILGGGRLL